jgi:hypothetical protein
VADSTSGAADHHVRDAFMDRVRRGDSYSVLLVLILLTYTVMALAGKGLWARFVVSAMLGGVLLLAFYTSHFRGRAFRISAVIVGIAVLNTFVQALLGRHGGDGTTFIMFLLVLAAPVVILARIVRHRVVGFETVLGAICVYVLLGIAFAGIFAGINDIDNGRFFVQTHIPTFIDFLYFSFVVLTTLGFGDLTPKADVARVVVTFEALIGQVFLVTLVARLVALYGTERKSELEQ